MGERMLARVVAQVCGEQGGRLVSEEVRGALEDGLGREEVAVAAGRAVERLVWKVLGELHAMTATAAAAVNEDVEREAA